MNKKCDGFSLLELMIVSLLSVVVLGVLLSIVIDSQRTRATLSCFKSVQDQGRSVLNIIAKDIAVAGYRECSSMSDTTFSFQPGIDLSALTDVARRQLNYQLELRVPISGFGAFAANGSVATNPVPMLAYTDADGVTLAAGMTYVNSAPTSLQAEQGEYLANFPSFFAEGNASTATRGDLLTLRYIGDRSWSIVDQPPGTVRVRDPDPDPTGDDIPRVGDLLYIGDCYNGSTFMVTAVVGPAVVNIGGISVNNVYTLTHDTTPIENIVNGSANLNGVTFEQSGIVASIDTVHYSLGVSEFAEPVPDGEDLPVPALFRARFRSNVTDMRDNGFPADLNGLTNTEEIAPGIVDLGVRFGTSNTPNDAPNRVQRISETLNNRFIKFADLSVQASAIENCGAGDDDDSTGWSRFTMRFERLIEARNLGSI